MPTKPRKSCTDCTYEFLAADKWPCDRCTFDAPGPSLDDRIDEHEAMMRRVPAWKRFLLSLLP